ncbi:MULTISPECIES: ABC transporter ATP-binding protein [Klebsiella]|nr:MULTISPECIES: ABC transporter ATP-binding protein [Klebsiella]MBM7152384.1 ABC transporter ATP-binding protein [Klebsiella variicola]MCI7875956.1 ABC transporter ATP-binding protein [Klebsiella pneumoniae]MCI7906416.1 ABC transporter ATP-binding protein [Klebsiella pneumoniae]MCP5602157.1 ABC transporter ATP-binding protein [Klebsiella pneumoniae]SVM30754.1 Urea ABC transporter [Klebsiella pneumoniae]
MANLMRPELLSVQQLHTGYGNIPILFGVDLTLFNGELVGVLGHNGMGKTTLLKAIMGHLPATSGSLYFAGKDITRLRPEARARMGMGIVPQGRQIFPALSVRENLQIGTIHQVPSVSRSKIEEVLEELPRLKSILNRQGGVLSGGEQQILALGRCLCMDPQLILLDEPTEGIQPSICDEIAESLQKLAGRNGLSIIIVEQDLTFISQLAQRVFLLRRGEISEPMDTAILSDKNWVAEFNGLVA